MEAIVHRLLVVVAVVLGAALSASDAYAAAVITRFSFSQTDVFPVAGYFCLPDSVGTATQTETSTGQVVQTPSGVFTFHGVDTFNIHVDFADGSYVQSGPINRDHNSFVFNSPLTVATTATQDFETIYNAQGQPIGKIMIHEIIHVTFMDQNGNGQPDPGEISVQFDRFRLSCT
jgi:hypothetical protein